MRSKSKKQRKARDYANIKAIIAFIIGTVIGSGAVWQWQQIKINKLSYELNKMESIRKISDDMQTKVLKALDLKNKYTDLHNTYIKNPSEENRVQYNRGTERIVKYELQPIEDDIKRLEKMLAKLEDREPKIINIPRPEPIPYNLRVLTLENPEQYKNIPVAQPIPSVPAQ